MKLLFIGRKQFLGYGKVDQTRLIPSLTASGSGLLLGRIPLAEVRRANPQGWYAQR